MIRQIFLHGGPRNGTVHEVPADMGGLQVHKGLSLCLLSDDQTRSDIYEVRMVIPKTTHAEAHFVASYASEKKGMQK